MAKVMVSLPDDLLSEIDAAARRRSTTRSGLLAEAARKELSCRDPGLMRAAVARMEARGAQYGAPTSAEVRADREAMDARDRSR